MSVGCVIRGRVDASNWSPVGVWIGLNVVCWPAVFAFSEEMVIVLPCYYLLGMEQFALFLPLCFG
jgi:hypothetical protein